MGNHTAARSRVRAGRRSETASAPSTVEHAEEWPPQTIPADTREYWTNRYTLLGISGDVAHIQDKRNGQTYYNQLGTTTFTTMSPEHRVNADEAERAWERSARVTRAPAPVVQRTTSSLIPYHPLEDRGKYDAITADMVRRGWHGTPLVRWGDNLLTGAHRSRAAASAGLHEVPTVNLPDVFREDGKDFQAYWRHFDQPSITNPGAVAQLVTQLSDRTRAKYGIDIQ